MTFQPTDQAKAAWDAAIPLLMTGGMAERAARSYFGRLLSTNRIGAESILEAVQAAQRSGTGDPAAYLFKAAQRVRTARSDPALKASWT